MRKTTVICLHFDADLKYQGETHKARITEALQPMPLEIVEVIKPGLSAKYDTRTGLAGRYTFEQFVAKYAPKWREGDPLVVVAFSAACWALRHWIGQEFALEHLTAGIMLDGLHTSRKEVLAGVLKYARKCIDGDGLTQRLVVTNSDIDPITYASTSETAELLLDELGCTPRIAPDEGVMPGVRVVDYGVSKWGNVAADHVAHVSQLLPLVLHDEIAPLLFRALNVTRPDDVPAIILPEETITPGTFAERCLEVMRREVEASPVKNVYGKLVHVPTDAQIAKYFGGAVREFAGLGEKPLGISAGNYCAVFQGWVEHQARLPGESVHKWRGGAKRELITDGVAMGTWVAIRPREFLEQRLAYVDGTVVDLDYIPSPGDLAIYDRPTAKGSSWYGHVDRVERVLSPTLYETTGGNEQFWRYGEPNGFRTEKLNRDHPNLLGFRRAIAA